jgi:hypothetical protein
MYQDVPCREHERNGDPMRLSSLRLGALRRILWHFRNVIRGDYDLGKLSFSQSGEDLAIARALQAIGVGVDPKTVRYLDVGATASAHFGGFW